MDLSCHAEKASFHICEELALVRYVGGQEFETESWVGDGSMEGSPVFLIVELFAPEWR